MTSGALPVNPFVAAGMIEDPRLFVGRKDELHAIASRMKGDQPTSINIVGDKHIGKSSLLHYFVLTWQQRVLNNSSNYVVIYLPLRGVDCQTETGFYEAVAEGLLNHVQGWQQRSLQNCWKSKPLNRQAFSDAVKQWKQQGKLPVLCLDDFESLLKYPDKFDNGFYDNLRSLMDGNALMLVVASRKELDVYANEHRFVSSFFNIGHTISLKELTLVVDDKALNFAGSMALVVGLVMGVTTDLAFGVGAGMAFILSVLRVYFWLPELLWILTLFFVSSYGKRVNCLRYLPPRFDELIILPLPFMAQMIVEAYRNNPASGRETINYLISSTNQQKVAAQAISGIAVDILNRCQRLSDIVEIANQLAWIPSPAPKELGTVLPQFLDISQNVRASQEATSLYRQYELLNIPITALRQLAQSLALTTDARVAVSFGNTVQSWLTILETAQRTLNEQAQQSKEIRQVYIAGNSLDPETARNRFKGRIDIFREIESLALSEQPPVLLLYGGRRTGKTSALKYLPYRIGSDIIPLLVDLQGAASATTLKGLAENLAKQITEAPRQLARKIYFPKPDANRLAEDPFPALQTWLTEIERSNPGRRFLLCLDEYERLGEVVKATSSRAPLNFIRNLLQYQRKWILLFSGSQELSELDDYWSDYLINTRALRMTYLHELEARDLIQQPVENFSNIYEPNAVDAIIQVTRCQPYLVQLVCYEVVELLNRDIRRNRREADTAKATAQDVKEVIPVVLERGDQYFRELWKSLTDSDRSLLRRIIHGETPTQQDKGVVRKLTRKEILTQEGNAFQVPLVQKYIEQLLEEE